MRSFFKQREVRITKKQSVIAILGIVLLVGIYWGVTHRSEPISNVPVPSNLWRYAHVWRGIWKICFSKRVLM